MVTNSFFISLLHFIVSDRSGSARSTKSNNRSTGVTVANSDLLPEKEDSVICRPLTDANGLLTVDVATTIIQIPDTKDHAKSKDAAAVKVKDPAREKDVNRERLIVLANNKTNCGNPQVIVTAET